MWPRTNHQNFSNSTLTTRLAFTTTWGCVKTAITSLNSMPHTCLALTTGRDFHEGKCPCWPGKSHMERRARWYTKDVRLVLCIVNNDRLTERSKRANERINDVERRRMTSDSATNSPVSIDCLHAARAWLAYSISTWYETKTATQNESRWTNLKSINWIKVRSGIIKHFLRH